MVRKILFTFLIFFFSLNLFSQSGIIKGIIIDKKTRETLVGANVWIDGTTTGTSTDINGEFTLNNLKIGTYKIMVSIISYRRTILDNVKVTKDHITELSVELEEEVTTMQEVEIVDKRTTNTEISIINVIKNTNLIANGISSQQIQKSQDRDASEVIRRVPGVTLFNGQFVIVRGLNQRYNSVSLNNASTPSSETDTRAFSFDIIPSSLLENIMIYKNPSPELPADFSGAYIAIATRNNPSKNSVDISYSVSFREGTTFNDFYKYKGGSLDFLGIDDGTRALPQDFPTTEEFKQLTNTYTQTARDEVTKLGQEISKTWMANSGSAMFDNRFNIAVSNNFKLGKVSATNIAAINYTNTFLYLPIHRLDYQVYDFADDKPSPNFDFYDQQYTNTAKTGAILNFSFILNRKNKIVLQNLFNQIGFTRTTLREGIEYYSSQQVHSFEYYFQSRIAYLGQLGGEHEIKKSASLIKWTLSYSYSDRNEPNQKRLTTILNTTSGDTHYNEYGIAFGNTASPKYAGIVYQKLREHIFMGKIDFTQPFSFNSFKPELRVGFYGEYKKRTFSARLLGYIKSSEDQFNQDLPYSPFDSVFRDQNINYTSGIKLDESTNPSDSYDASNAQLSGYFTMKIPIMSRITIYAGLRAEHNHQQMNSFSSDLSTLPVQYDRNIFSVFPSANITFDLNAKSLIRLAYGQSINRPEFREIAPFNFYMFQENASFVGNPNLKDARIQNVDARYELYPTLSELISLAVFYKQFSNPIEIAYVNSGSGLAYGPVNAKSAYTYGVEVELRKSFSDWGDRKGFLSCFKDFSIVLNASYIQSQVQFPDGAIERDRYMQGQSPYIVNAGLYYLNTRLNISSSLLYNVMGKRIIVVGQPNQNPQEDIPDMYELPFNSLDFTFSRKFGKNIQIKVGVQNLVNQNVRFQQTVKYDVPGKGTIERVQPNLTYKAGRYYTIGISLIF